MTDNAILLITDGTTTVNLLGRKDGFLLKEWTPVIADVKDGGIFVDSPLSNGRRLVMRNYNNVIDTFELTLRSASQDLAIREIRLLRTLLTKAHEYWTSEWTSEPVYIVARGSCETETRYAIIKDWNLQMDDNPYASPFGGKKPAMNDLTLILEHDFWTLEPPGEGECVEVSGVKTAYSGIATDTAYPSSSDHDAYVTISTTTIDLTSNTLLYGNRADYEAGILFDAVAIPAGAVILYAHISVYCPGATNDTPCYVVGELNATPAAFTTYANFMGRTDTDSIVEMTLGNGVGYQNTDDIKDIVQEIVDLPGWATGQDMVFKFRGTQRGNPQFTEFESYDSKVHIPLLYVVFATSDAEFGQEATCEPNVFVSNKQNQANITDALYWDNDAASYIDVGSGAFPRTIMADIETDDYLLLGSTEGPFCSLVFDIMTPQVGQTLRWEYWNGAWTTFDPYDETDDGDPFELTGVCSVAWKQENDWATRNENGVVAYWVRVYVVAGDRTQDVVQQNRDIYTVVRPSVDIAADQVPGDIPAKARIVVRSRCCNTTVDSEMLWESRLFVSLRSSDRGDDFQPFLNASDEQHQVGVTCAVSGGGSFEDDTYDGGTYSASPTKRFIVDGAGASFASVALWTIDGSVSQQYRGTYNVFLRYAQSDTDDGVFVARLKYSGALAGAPAVGGVMQVTNPVTLNVDATTPKSKHLVSLGSISLLTGVYDGDSPGDISLELEIRQGPNAVGGEVFVLYEIMLMPVDEWFGAYTALAGEDDGLTDGTYLDIDGGVNYPKPTTRALLKDANVGSEIKSMWTIIQNGPPILQTNRRQQLIFLLDQFTVGDNHAISNQGSLYSIRVEKQSRYFSMLGDGT